VQINTPNLDPPKSILDALALSGTANYLRSTVAGLLRSKGKQPPIIKPNATAPAKTSPHGRSIDLQNTNRRLTKLAFWTDMSAITTIQAAAIVEIIKFVIALVLSCIFTEDERGHS
jgi:hypothetical protein